MFGTIEEALSPLGITNDQRERFGYPAIEVKPWTCDHTTKVSDTAWRCPTCHAELR